MSRLEDATKMKLSRVRSIAAWCAGLALLCAAPEAQAASGDADGTFTVTISQVEISKDGGASYTTLFSGSKEINIAAANAGAVATGLASGVALSPGTYNQVRVTIGATLQIKGFVNNGAGTGTLYTNNDADGFDLNNTAINTPGGDYAVSTLPIPASQRVDTMAVSIVIPSEGSPPTVRVNFDTSGVLSATGDTPSINDPTVTISQS